MINIHRTIEPEIASLEVDISVPLGKMSTGDVTLTRTNNVDTHVQGFFCSHFRFHCQLKRTHSITQMYSILTVVRKWYTSDLFVQQPHSASENEAYLL